MANRKQRRAARKAHRVTIDDRIRAMSKNGITPRDLLKEFERGREDGFCQASELALNDLYGYGQKRCFDVLTKVDDYVTNTLVSTEAIEEVYDRMKLELDFGSPEGHVMRMG